MKYLLLAAFALLLCVPAHGELVHGPDDVYIRVVDVGAGLCCVVRMPGDKYMIYDAGYKEVALDDILEIIPEDSEIELLVLSHSDADHIGAVDEILDYYTVKTVLRSGNERTTQAWTAANNAIKTEKNLEGCMDINLSKWEFPPGATYKFGDVFVTMVCGFGLPPKEWGLKKGSETNNGGSIVIRLWYDGSSVLFCGDAVGRHLKVTGEQCIGTEKYMVDMSDVITIDSDVIIAPHHGSDGGNSKRFIKAVSPEYVIFAAGHKHQHPTAKAAKRYLDCGIDVANIFRTDLEDDEKKPNKPYLEWTHGRKKDHKDKSGDDSVDIVLRKGGGVDVDYR